MAYIYKIHNKLTNQVYIGQSATEDYERMWEHFDYVYPGARGVQPSLKDNKKATAMMQHGGLSDFTITIYNQQDNYGIDENVFQTFASIFQPEGKATTNIKKWVIHDKKIETRPQKIQDYRNKLDMAEILHVINAERQGIEMTNKELGGTYKYWSMANQNTGRTYQIFRDKSPKENIDAFKTSTYIIQQAQQIIDSHVQKFLKTIPNYVTELSNLVALTFKQGLTDQQKYSALRKKLLEIFGYNKRGTKYQYQGEWSALSNDRLRRLMSGIENSLNNQGLSLTQNMQVKKDSSNYSQAYGLFKKTMAEAIAANVIFNNQSFRNMFALDINGVSTFSFQSGPLFTISAALILDLKTINAPHTTWWHCTPRPSKVLTENVKQKRSLKYFMNILRLAKDKDIYNGATAFVPFKYVQHEELYNYEMDINRDIWPDVGYINFTQGTSRRPLTFKVKDYYRKLNIHGTFLEHWDKFFSVMYNVSTKQQSPWIKYDGLGQNVYYNKYIELPLTIDDKTETVFGAYHFPAHIDINDAALSRLKFY